MSKHGKQHTSKLESTEEWKNIKEKVVIGLLNEVIARGIGVLEMGRRLNMLRQSVRTLRIRCLDPEADVTFGSVCALKWVMDRGDIVIGLNDTNTNTMTLLEMVAYRKENFSYMDVKRALNFNDDSSVYAFEKSLLNGKLNFRFSNLYLYMRFLCVDSVKVTEEEWYKSFLGSKVKR